MADEDEPAKDADGCARQAAKMRAEAQKAFDPSVAAQYLSLAAEWLRLAEAHRAQITDPRDPAGPDDA